MSSCTHHKHRATLTGWWPLFHSQLYIGTSQCLVAWPPRCTTWSCAREWSAPSRYGKHHQTLLVAVDTRRHPVNAQRSLKIKPVCMSILAKHTQADRDTHSPALKRTHTIACTHMCTHRRPHGTHTAKTLKPRQHELWPLLLKFIRTEKCWYHVHRKTSYIYKIRKSQFDW